MKSVQCLSELMMPGHSPIAEVGFRQFSQQEGVCMFHPMWLSSSPGSGNCFNLGGSHRLTESTSCWIEEAATQDFIIALILGLHVNVQNALPAAVTLEGCRLDTDVLIHRTICLSVCLSKTLIS